MAGTNATEIPSAKSDALTAPEAPDKRSKANIILATVSTPHAAAMTRKVIPDQIAQRAPLLVPRGPIAAGDL